MKYDEEIEKLHQAREDFLVRLHRLEEHVFGVKEPIQKPEPIEKSSGDDQAAGDWTEAGDGTEYPLASQMPSGSPQAEKVVL